MRATVSRRRLLGYGLGLAGAASLPTRPGRAADPHVVVIGAGLAGIAGARALLRAGIKVTVLEARNRIGGRAFTDPASLGTPYDQGCFWLHAADRNPVADLIDTLGFELVPDPQDPTVYLDGQALADSDPLEESLDRAAFALDRAGETRGDVAVASVLTPRAPLDRLAADLVGRLGFGVELGELSVTDVTSSTVGDVEMVVRGGLGSAIALYGGELPVLKSTPVRRIGWGGSGVRVGTAAGTIAADAVLVTVPPGVLAAGAIRFDPALPADKQAAIANLPMGRIEKIALAFDRDVTDMVSFGTLHAELRDGSPLHALVRPFGQELVICSVGGDQARALGTAGMQAGIDFALSGLAELFGNDVRLAFRKGHMTGWGSDPFAHGAVAAARPGHAAARAALAAPLADRLFFAGDACVPQWAGQIAGALLSGQRAAADILAVL